MPLRLSFATSLLLNRTALGSVAAAVALGAAPRLHAQTLTEAMAQAYASNPQLLSQRASQRATDELVPQALSNWRPTVTAVGNIGWERLNVQGAPTTTTSVAPAQTVAAGGTATATTGVAASSTSTTTTSQTVRTNSTTYFHPNTVQISGTQPIYRGGRTEAQVRQAENLVRSARAQTLATEQTTLLNAVTIYMNTLRDQVTLELNIANEQVLGRQLESVQAQFRVGELTRTDTSQAESSLASATAGRVAAEGTLESDRATFLRVIGLPVVKLTYPTSRPRVPATREEAVALATDRNPNIIQSQFAEAAAQANVSLQRGQLLPTVSLQGSGTRSYETSSIGVTSKTASGTATATIPIYEGGLYYSQTRQASQTVTQRHFDTETNRRSSIESAVSAWENLNSTRTRLIALQAAVDAAQVALTGTQQEQAVGARTVLDVLIAEQTVFSAKVNFVSAQRDEIVYLYTLAAAVGQLTAEDLNLPVQRYDMEKNYRLVRDKWYGFGVASDDPNQEPSRQPGQPNAPKR